MLHLKNELDESQLKYDQSERKRKLIDEDLFNSTQTVNDLKTNNEYLLSSKNKLERDLNSLSVSFNDKFL